MNSRTKYFIIGIAAFLLGCAVWYLKMVVLYIVIALIISMICQPIVRLFSKLKYKKIQIPESLSALLALGVFVSVFIFLISMFIPLIIEEARIISQINPSQVIAVFKEPLQSLQLSLQKFQVNNINTTSIENYITTELASVINFQLLSGYAEGMIGFTTSFIGGTLSILFMSFFFIKDDRMIARFILVLTPPKHLNKIKEILRETKRLLTRYFIGLLLDMLFVATITSIGLSIIGVQNALLIGMFAGIINIIPYVGPVIGLAFGLLIGATSNLEVSFYAQLLPLLGKIAFVFLIVQLIDALLFQPLVISNIVKAHPIEIFLVVLIAGTLAGIGGMIVAVPVYTILRIIAKEFLSNFQIVKNLTENLDD